MQLAELISDDINWIDAEASVAAAVERLALAPSRASCLLVGDGRGQPAGIVTAFDLLRAAACTALKPRRLQWAHAEGRLIQPEDLARASIFDEMASAAAGTRVRDIMTSPVSCIAGTASPAQVMDLLIHRRIDAAPVLRDGRVVGLVHRRALVDALARVMGGVRA